MARETEASYDEALLIQFENNLRALQASNFDPPGMVDLLKRTPIRDLSGHIKPKTLGVFQTVRGVQLDNKEKSGWLNELLSVTQQQYPGLKADQTINTHEKAYVRFLHLWEALNNFHHAETTQKISPDQLRGLTAQQAEDRVRNWNADEKREKFRLVLDPDTDPYIELLATIPPDERKEQQIYSLVAEALQNDPNFCSLIQESLRTADWPAEIDNNKQRGATSTVSFATLDVDGKPVPIAIKQFHPLLADMRDSEQKVIQEWEQQNPDSFKNHSALQVIRENDVWMLDLHRLGYIPADQVFKRANTFTHPGRMFLLQYFTNAAKWLSEMEQFCTPIDTFPKGDAIWHRELPNGIWDMRTIDYGLFQSPLYPKKIKCAHNIWFGNVSGDKQGALWRAPSLLPVMYGCDDIASQDTYFRRIGLYDKLTDLRRDQHITHKRIHQVFLDALTQYQNDSLLHKSWVLPRVTSRGIAWYDTLRALEKRLSPLEKGEVAATVLNDIPHDDEQFSKAIRFQTNLNDPLSDILTRIAQENQCSLNDASTLLNNIPHRYIATLLDRWSNE